VLGVSERSNKDMIIIMLSLLPKSVFQCHIRLSTIKEDVMLRVVNARKRSARYVALN
jgi:hypothetical protein